jgi:hypothetical protein
MTQPETDLFADIGASDNERLQVAKELFTQDNIKLKTELSDREVFLLSRLLFMAETFRIPEMTSWCENFMKLRVSHKRKGRGEFLDAVKTPPMDMSFMGGGTRFGGLGGLRRI